MKDTSGPSPWPSSSLSISNHLTTTAPRWTSSSLENGRLGTRHRTSFHGGKATFLALDPARGTPHMAYGILHTTYAGHGISVLSARILALVPRNVGLVDRVAYIGEEPNISSVVEDVRRLLPKSVPKIHPHVRVPAIYVCSFSPPGVERAFHPATPRSMPHVRHASRLLSCGF